MSINGFKLTMRRLKSGDVDSILEDFLQLSAPIAYVEYKGVDPSYLKKQLARKIRSKGYEKISVKLIGNLIQLENKDRSWKTNEEGKLIINIPTIRRCFKGE